MPLFYLHLRDDTEETLDPEGVELSDLDAVGRAVLASARDVMGNELKSGGVVDLRFRIDAEAADGTIVYSLRFSEAVTIIPEAS